MAISVDVSIDLGYDKNAQMSERSRYKVKVCARVGAPTLAISRSLVRDPAKGPIRLLLDTRYGLNGVEEVLALLRVLDVCVDEERIRLGMDVLHHNLEAVEASRFSSLNLVRKTFNQILVDNTVRGGEEGEDEDEGAAADEVAEWGDE